jgi:CubicO group peptidase (beta-lactamase class C family)
MALFAVRLPALTATAIISIALGLSRPSLASEPEPPFTCKAAPLLSLAVAGNPPSPSAVSAVVIPPAQIDQAIQALDGIVQKALARSGVPGLSIAVVRDDKVVYAKGFGVRQAGTDQRVDENTVFQLASVSKPLGATVIARLVGQGLADWNAHVVKDLPGFALSDRYVTRHVTVGDLYTHRSGLPDHAGDLLEDLGYGRAQVLNRLRFEPLAPFRTTHIYTNFGLTAAAQAVANARGTTWEDLSRQVLYEPLGMNSTSSRYVDYANAANHAVLHVQVGDHWEPRYTRQPDAQSPAGGASSSVADMARWLRLQLANGKFNGEQVVEEKALIQTRCPYTISNPPDTSLGRASFYGLGIGVSYDEAGRVRFSHSGGFALGAATAFTLLPSENLGVVVLTNGMPNGVPEAVIATFLDLVELGKVQRDWLEGYQQVFARLSENHSKLAGQTPPAKPIPAKPNAAYVGRYENPYVGPAQISAANGGLVLKLGPNGMEFPLQHWDGDTFAYYPSGENALGISAVTFKVNGGRATQLTLENFDENRLGTLSRGKRKALGNSTSCGSRSKRCLWTARSPRSIRTGPVRSKKRSASPRQIPRRMDDPNSSGRREGT